MIPAQASNATGYDYLEDLDKVEYIDTPSEAKSLCGMLMDLSASGTPVALDYETTGVNPARETPVNKGWISTIQLSWLDESEPTRFFVNAVGKPGIVQALRPWIEDTRRVKVIHNYPFEAHISLNHGMQLGGLLADTLQLSRLENAERISHSLDGPMGLSRSLLRIPAEMRLTTKAALGTYKYKKDGSVGSAVELRDMDEIAMDSESLPYLMVYGTNDTYDTLLLYYLLRESMEGMAWTDERGLWGYYEDYHRAFQEIVVGMERRGFPIDLAWASNLRDVFSQEVESLNIDLWGWAGCSINWNSVPQKTWCLYGRAGEIQHLTAQQIPIVGHGLPMPPIKDGANGPSTDKEALAWILDRLDYDSEDAQAIRNLQERAKLSTLLSGTLSSIQEGSEHLRDDNVIHCSYGIAGARTGRMACRNPNLQQVPSRSEQGRMIREAFMAPPGHVVLCADYSQLELRILGYYLVYLFDDRQLADDLDSGDLHQATADRLSSILGYTVERAVAKAVNFGIVYGISKYKISTQTGMSLDEAEKLLTTYFQTYPGIRQYIAWAKTTGFDSGCARTILGRYRPLPNIRSRNRKASSADERRAMNTPIQGSAQDIVMLAMIELEADPELRGLGFVQRLQIHDEIVATCPARFREQACVAMKRVMDNVLDPHIFDGISLRVDAHWGTTWAEAKEGQIWD